LALVADTLDMPSQRQRPETGIRVRLDAAFARVKTFSADLCSNALFQRLLRSWPIVDEQYHVKIGARFIGEAFDPIYGLEGAANCAIGDT
jgi:hypothetical protein